MTPAHAKAIAVAVDGLREAGVDPADVVRALFDEAVAPRMLRATKPDIELAVVRFMTAQDYDAFGDDETQETNYAARARWEAAVAMLREVACLITYPHLPSAETSSGATTPRPEGDPLCGNCGHDFPSHANGIRPCDHRAHGNAAECGCVDWTLVGTSIASSPAHEPNTSPAAR